MSETIGTATPATTANTNGWFGNVLDGLATAAGSYTELLIAQEYAQTQAQIDAISAQTQVQVAQAEAQAAAATASANRSANGGWKPWMTYTAVGVVALVGTVIAYKVATS